LRVFCRRPNFCRKWKTITICIGDAAYKLHRKLYQIYCEPHGT